MTVNELRTTYPDVMTTDWRRIAVFLAVTFAVSWSHWLSIIGSQRGWIGSGLEISPVAIFGPLVGAVAVSDHWLAIVAVIEGRHPSSSR